MNFNTVVFASMVVLCATLFGIAYMATTVIK